MRRDRLQKNAQTVLMRGDNASVVQWVKKRRGVKESTKAGGVMRLMGGLDTILFPGAARTGCRERPSKRNCKVQEKREFL